MPPKHISIGVKRGKVDAKVSFRISDKSKTISRKDQAKLTSRALRSQLRAQR